MLCPALPIGVTLGSGLAVTILPVAWFAIEGALAFAIGGVIAGAATGLLIRRPLPLRRSTIVAIVIGLLVNGAMGVVMMGFAGQLTGSLAPWAQLPIPVLVGTAVMIVAARVIWALRDRTR